MSNKTTRAFDVFLSFAAVDRATAEAVRREFESAGLTVFSADQLMTGEQVSVAVRRGIQECVAFVALLTPSHLRSSNLALEIGAAWVWSTPIYLLLSDVRAADIPPYLSNYRAVPLWGGLAQVVEEVRERARPLSDTERKILADVYQEVGVSVDRLITEPSAIDQLAEDFSARSRRRLDPTRLVRELMRIRKTGRLPKLSQGTAK